MTGRTFAVTGALLALCAGITTAYLLWLPDVTDLKSSNPMTTQYVRIYVRRMHRKGDRPSVSMTWTPLDKMSPYLVRAVLIAEDDRFYRHRGVDWGQLRRAARYNIQRGRMVRGASTISQQVARNLFLSPTRRPARKLKEILYARHLERTLGKDRILEIYLNIVEWGEGVFGAEAASRAYFGRSASDLTPEQAVELAAALPSPYERNPAVPPSERMLKLREVYMERLRNTGLIEEDSPGADAIPNQK